MVTGRRFLTGLAKHLRAVFEESREFHSKDEALEASMVLNLFSWFSHNWLFSFFAGCNAGSISIPGEQF